MVSTNAYAQTNNYLYNGFYKGDDLNKVAFPIRGVGTGVFCLEGTGATSHLSVLNSPDMFNEPAMFATLSIKEIPNSARALEGPVPGWKKFH